MRKHTLPPPPDGHRYIFRPRKYCPHKKRYVYASEYGLKAFPIIVPE